MSHEISGITHDYAQVNGIRLHFVHGGKNRARPIMLVHGLFETWRMWRYVLPALMENHYVVVPDMRGYGESDKPPLELMDKGNQARDFYELVQQLELGKFLLYGHDRGARAARRYGLDYPETLLGLALLDILPTEYIYQEMTSSTVGSHHWDQLFKLASPISEQLLASKDNIELYVRHFYNRSEGFLDLLQSDGTWEHYFHAITQPGAMLAVLNDYRAAFNVDVPRLRDEINRGIKIETPTLILWGKHGNLSRSPAMDIWNARCADAQGAEAPCGHYLPEEAPELVLNHMLRFADQRFAS